MLRAGRIPQVDPRPMAELQARSAAAEATIAGLHEQLDLQVGRIGEFQQRIREMSEAEAERVSSDGRVLVALSPVAESLRLV